MCHVAAAINVVTVGDNPVYLSPGCTVDDDSCYDTVQEVKRGPEFHNPLYDLTKDEDKLAADDYCEGRSVVCVFSWTSYVLTRWLFPHMQ